MLKQWNKAIREAQFVSDMFIIAASYLAAYLIASSSDFDIKQLKPISDYLLPLFISIPLWTIFLYTGGAYGSLRIGSLFRVVWPILKAWALVGLTLTALLFVLKKIDVSRSFTLLYMLISGASLTTERVCVYSILRHVRKTGYNYRNILIVGTGDRAQSFANKIKNHAEWGLRIIGFVDDDPDMVGKELQHGRVIGLISDLPQLVTGMEVDEVVFVVPRKWLDKLSSAVLLCEQVGIKARVAADLYDHQIARTAIEEIEGWPLLTFDPTPHPAGAVLAKRIIDVTLSGLLLVIGAPLFNLIALGIKLTSRGPIFFKQMRCGLNGRKFAILKFRTMVQDAEALKTTVDHMNEMSGPVFKARNDPRITRFGKFLRKFSLDEFPQLINVLKGDMSIVGPRPPIPDEVAQYGLWQRRRLSMKPGITCLWQVNGRNTIGFDEWTKLDLQYIDNWSLILDLKILLRTIPTVLTGTGQ